MAHQIATLVNGKAAFVFEPGFPGWHGLGQEMPAGASLAAYGEALDAGRKVAKVPLMYAGPDGIMVQAPDAFAVVRCERDGSLSHLGTVGARQTIVQDTAIIEALSPLTDAGATPSCAMYLFDGQVFTVTLNLPDSEAEIKKGDVVRCYAMASHANTGKLSLCVGAPTIRVVCWNTQKAAYAEGNVVKFRHTTNGYEKFKNVAKFLMATRHRFGAECRVYRELSRKNMSDAQMKAFLERLIPKPKAPAKGAASPVPPSSPTAVDAASLLDDILGATPDYTAREPDMLDFVHEQAERDRRDPRAWAEITELFMGGMRGGSDGTFWSGLNAVTEYTTHHAGRSESARWNSVNNGAGASLNSRALEILVDMSGAQVSHDDAKTLGWTK